MSLYDRNLFDQIWKYFDNEKVWRDDDFECVRCGFSPSSAKCIFVHFMFDPSERTDVASFDRMRTLYGSAIEWVDVVAYDERNSCEARHRIKPPNPKNLKWETCTRATGVFVAMGLRVRALSAAPTRGRGRRF